MSVKYDSKKIRELAHRLGKTAETVAEINTNSFRPVRNELPDNFRGKAGTALDESLTDLMREVYGISGQLKNIQNALNKLARQLEQADEESRGIIKQH